MINFLLISVHFPFLSKSRAPNTVKNLNKRLRTVRFINPRKHILHHHFKLSKSKNKEPQRHTPAQAFNTNSGTTIGPQAPNVDFLTALVGGA